MLKAIDKRILYGIAGVAGVAVYTIVLILKVPYSIFIMGGLSLAGLGIICAFTNYKPLFSLAFVLIPLSFELALGAGDSKILFPSEVMIIILGIGFMATVFFFRSNTRDFLRHPLSLVVMSYIIVLLVTTATSQMIVVSIKFTLVNLLYIMDFYFLTNMYVHQAPDRGMRIYYMYGMAVFLVVVYALFNHSAFGFDRNASNLVVKPFYTDHAIYSACLAMLLPAFTAFGFKGKVLGLKPLSRIFSLVVFMAMVAGIFFSYSRAAWISLAAAIMFYFLLRIRLRPGYFMGLLFIGFVIGFMEKDVLINNSRMNRNSSTSANPSIEEQTKSVTNISTDVSNAERLNRWSCAWRMFLDKPFTGFGPGTYQFQYLDYQRPGEMTRISVVTAYNNPLGKGGSAHSEYLLALAESGITGFLCMIFLVLLAIFYAMRTYYRASSEKERILVAVPFLGFLTYCIHVFFNNYLNIDKTASLFWASLSILVSVCIAQEQRNKIKTVVLED